MTTIFDCLAVVSVGEFVREIFGDHSGRGLK